MSFHFTEDDDVDVSSWKNTLVMTMSPVLSVWHTASDVDVVVPTARAATSDDGPLRLPDDDDGVDDVSGGRTGEYAERIERASWQLHTHRLSAALELRGTERERVHQDICKNVIIVRRMFRN